MLCYLLLLALSLSPALSQTPDCGCEAKPHINVLAVVNGVKITQQDLSIGTRTQVSIIQETVITARRQELNRQISKILLEGEAKRRGLTTAKLLELEVTGKVKPPTEKEARAFYEQNKSRGDKDFNSVKKEVIERLRQEREAMRASELTLALRAGAQVIVSDELVTPPTSEADLSRVFATVNGQEITSRDIEQALLPLISRIQQQVYTLRKNDLDTKINDLLLEQEAKRLNTSAQFLIDQNVRLKMPIITDDQARAFYEKNKTKMKGKFENLKFEIVQLLFKEELRKLSLAYSEQLRSAAAVQIYLTPPRPLDLRQLCCNPVD